MIEKDGRVFWQITFDNDTYGKMLNVVSCVAEMPIRETYNPPQQQGYRRFSSYNTNLDTDYHRDKI